MKNIFFIGSGGHFKEIFNWYKEQIKIKNLKSNIKGIIDDRSKLKIEKNSKLIMKKSLRLIFFLTQNSKVREKIDTRLK